MTILECETSVRELFQRFFPTCTVIFSYPDSARPTLPYLVLDFGSVQTEPKIKDSIDGVERMQFQSSMSFSAELFTKGDKSEIIGAKKNIDTSLQDMQQFVLFLESNYAGNYMSDNNISITANGSVYPVHNSLNGVSAVMRARGEYTVDFIQSVSGMAGIRPTDGEYTQTGSGASRELASLNTGYFTSVDINKGENNT